MAIDLDMLNSHNGSGESRLNSLNIAEPIDIAVRKLWLKMFKMYSQIAAEKGSAFSVGLVLLSIDKEGTPSTQLGPRMGMEPTSLSRQLKMMQEMGMIERETSTEDKRVVIVKLTSRGVQARRISRDTILAYNSHIYSSIHVADISIMLRTIQKISELTDDYIQDL